MRGVTFNVKVKIPDLELNKEAMKVVRQRAGEAIVPVVQGKVAAAYNDSGKLVASIKYINGKVRPSSTRRGDSKLNNYGLLRVLLHRDKGAKDPLDVDDAVNRAGAEGAQKGLAEVQEAILVLRGLNDL